MKFLCFLLAFGFTCCLRAETQPAESYELWFAVGKVEHHALLRRSGQGWEMRVRYFDPKCNCQRLIQEKFDVEKGVSGLKLRGHSVLGLSAPLDPGAYNADNLYLYFRPNGVVYASNIDAAGEMAKLNITPVKQEDSLKKFKDFGWERDPG